MSAKTFDLYDRDQYIAYLEHAAMQVALYGNLYLSFNGSHVTVHDARHVILHDHGPDLNCQACYNSEPQQFSDPPQK